MLYWKISSLVLQPCYTSECLFPPKSPILGCLVHFRAKVFNEHLILNLKIHLSRHLRVSYVYLFPFVSQAQHFLFFNSSCEIQLSSVLVFSIDVLLIACPEGRVTLLLKIFQIKHQWAFLKLRRLRTSAVTHAKFTANSLSALINEASKFFLILYRSYKRIRIDEKVCIRT